MLWAIFFSNVLTLIFCYPLFMLSIRTRGSYSCSSGVSSFNTIHISFLIVALMVSLHATLDVFIARHVLDAVNAGNYALVAIMGKIALYAPMGFMFVVFPKMVSFSSDVEKLRGLFIKSLVISCTTSLLFSIVLFFGTNTLVSLVFGTSYDLDPIVVFIYCLGMMVLGMNYQVFSLFLALSGNNKFIYRSAGLFILGFGCLTIYGHSELWMSGVILILNFLVFIQLCPRVITTLATK